jgi:aldehyde:ferredoxin oxidoreductase
MDSFVVCRFTNFAWSVDDYANIVAATTGLDIDGPALLTIGERIWNLERLFNIREGFSSKDDILPPRFSSPLPEGSSRDRIVHLEKMLPEYYTLRGWNKEGTPRREKLDQLDITED